MQIFIFILIVSVASSAPNREAFVCPRDDIANTQCLGPKDCLYPDPFTCNGFIQCVPQSDGSGIPVEMPCPAGLEWNDNEKICDWPHSSTCPSRTSTTTPSTTTTTTTTPSTTTTTTTTPSTTTTTTTTTTNAPTETTTTPKPIDFVCPIGDILATGCLGPKDCLYPDPTTCNGFIQCVPQPDGSGKPVQMPCAPSDPPLEWNDNTKQCDYAWNSTCPRLPSTTTNSTDSTTVAPTEATTSPKPNGFVCPRDDIAATGCMGPKDCLYPDPTTCNGFIQCVPQPDGSGKPVQMPCAPSNPPLEWNDNTKQCDYAWNSTCPRPPSTTSTPTPSTTTSIPSTSTTNSPTTLTTVTPSKATTTKPPSGFICPRDDIAATGCMGPKDCLYPDPTTCNGFIQCVPQPDGSGKPVQMPCAPSNPPLEWNDNTKQCDYAWNSTCPRSPSTTSTRRPTPSTTTSTPSTTTNSPTTLTTVTPSKATTTKPPSGFICPRDDIAATGCMGPKDCLYPDPTTCNGFIQCVPQPDGSGKPVQMPCAPSDPPLEWNDNTKQCDYAWNSTCPRSPSTTSTRRPTPSTTTSTPSTTTNSPTTLTTVTPPEATTTKPPSGFICPRDDIAATGCMGPKDCLYPDPTTCNGFIQCVPQPDGSGKPVQMPCAPSDPPLEWNDNTKRCDYAWNSTCPRRPSTTSFILHRLY